VTSELITTALFGAGGVGVVLLALWSYLRLGWRAARPVAEVLPPPDADHALAEALRRFRFVRKRAWSALARGSLLLLAYVAIILILGGGVFLIYAGHRLGDVALSLGWWETLPTPARYAGYFVALGLVSCALIGLVFHCRVMMLVREGKSTRWKALSDELDRAIGHGGILATLFFAGLVAVILCGWMALWGLAGIQVDHLAGWNTGFGVLIGLAAGAAVAWVLFMSAMFTFPVLAVRDPGWLSGVEASIGMLVLRRGVTWRAGLRATLLAASIYYWPAAIWMLLDFVDDQILLLSVLLRERDPRDVLKELDAQAPAQEGALRNADDLFQAGRYLDSLNLYQIFSYKNPTNLQGLEGIARAQLSIGNRQKAKEVLERLLMIEPMHPGGVRMMAEYQQGLWDDQGPLFREAHERCTQQLGKGVELKDVLDPELMRKMREREANGDFTAENPDGRG